MKRFLDKLICVSCASGGLLSKTQEAFQCASCNASYRIINGIPCFVSDDMFDYSEVKEADRCRFIAAKRFAYSGDSYINRLYNHYHLYAAEQRRRLSAPITLDVGFGIGEHYQFVGKLEKSEERFIGIDIDRFKLEHFSVMHPDIPVIQASAMQIPFSDESFDVVQLLATIEHFDAACALSVLRETLRVLKPGGYLIVCFPAEGSLLLRIGQMLMHRLIRSKTGFDLEHEEVHHHFLSAREIQVMLMGLPGLVRYESVNYPINVKNIHFSLFINETYRKVKV